MLEVLNRIKVLKTLMKKEGFDYYIIPCSDEHNNGYLPKDLEERIYLSGFNSSFGEIIIGKKESYFWTDSRYFRQAKKQLNGIFKVQNLTPKNSIEKWLEREGKNKKIAIKTRNITIVRAIVFTKIMANIAGKLIFSEKELVKKVRTLRNEIVLEKVKNIFLHREEYSGLSTEEKLKNMRIEMLKNRVSYLILTVLDEIAWTLNIRGKDFEFNPTFISYLVIENSKCTLFINKQKVDEEACLYLKENKIDIEEYNLFFKNIKNYTKTVWIDPATASYLLIKKISQKAVMFYKESPVIIEKACKNNIEINGSKIAHKKDAISLINFMSWLESNFQGQDEFSLKEKIEKFRQKQKNYRSPSFSTIVGYGKNSGNIHYTPVPETAKKISSSELLLIDSGGQYLEGTTDVTRTIHLGNPSELEIYYYTLVLKAHLALQNTIFPKGTKGCHIDVLARSHLWSNYLEYPHSTGHGVGSFLSVHEGPQSISPSLKNNQEILPGMIMSNEPGVYIEDKFGIRIENICYVKKNLSNKFGEFYALEDLTLIPYEKKLIDAKILNNEEINKVNSYHDKIRTTLMDKIEDQSVKNWLSKKTEKIQIK